jgi:hypothetical protein
LSIHTLPFFPTLGRLPRTALFAASTLPVGASCKTQRRQRVTNGRANLQIINQKLPIFETLYLTAEATFNFSVTSTPMPV